LLDPLYYYGTGVYVGRMAMVRACIWTLHWGCAAYMHACTRARAAPTRSRVLLGLAMRMSPPACRFMHAHACMKCRPCLVSELFSLTSITSMLR
jgi:hypothetical protein